MKQPSFLNLADSDSEDSLSISAPKTADRMAAAKKTKSRVAANSRVTKSEPKTATRRAGAKKAAAVEKELERQALATKPANEKPKRNGGGGGRAAKKLATVDEEDALATPPGSDEAVLKKRRGRPKKETAVVPDSVQRHNAGAKKGPKADGVLDDDEAYEIPETQQNAHMDIDEAEGEDQIEDLPTFSRFSAPPPSTHRNGMYHVPPSASKRPTSSSSFDSDPSVRRRLGEMTKKYESLELKYRDLKNVAVTEAEKTFDRLKKTSDEKSQAAAQLIASLKSDLAAQKQLAKEGQKSQQQLDASETKIDTLQNQVTEMTSSLAEARTEIKTLTAKLNAARAAEATATAQAQVAAARVPGSAMKPSAMGGRGLDAGQVQVAQNAKLRENLYSDLTGLVITGVKRDGPEDVYDCIQTGRNGTLHFKLAIANENSDENPDDAEFMYKPQLDERRDSDLIDILPDFLVEEISFPRPQAAKFYARVQKSLTERLE